MACDRLYSWRNTNGADASHDGIDRGTEDAEGLLAFTFSNAHITAEAATSSPAATSEHKEAGKGGVAIGTVLNSPACKPAPEMSPMVLSCCGVEVSTNSGGATADFIESPP